MSIVLSVEVLTAIRAVRLNVTGIGGELPTIVRYTPASPHPVTVRLAVVVSTVENFIAVDYEAPLDVPITYEVTAGAGTVGWTDTWHDDWDSSSLDSMTAAPVVVPSYGLDWVVALGQPSLSRVVTIESFPELTRELAASTALPLGAQFPTPVVFGMTGAAGVLTLITLSLPELVEVRRLLATSPLFQLKAPPDRGLEDTGTMYLLVRRYVESRATRLAQDPCRRIAVEVVQVARPPLEVAPPAENTWQDWEDAGATWAEWLDRSWLDLLTEDLGA